MKTIFFEVQDWEQELLKHVFPDALLVEDKFDSTIISKYADAEIISCFIYSRLNKEIIDQMPRLKCIATRSTGYDHIDVEYCKQKGIVVCNVPEYGSRTVAEYTFALMLMVSRKMYDSVTQLKECNFDHKKLMGFDLFGKTIGIVGLGKIGIEVLKIAQGFGMKVLANAHTQKPELAQQYQFTYVSLDELLQQSDIVTLHLPAIKETTHIINTQNVLNFKKGAILINTARGPLVQTEAILTGLEKGILSGVGLDVLEEETNLTEEAQLLSSHSTSAADFKTMCMDHVLINHPNVVATPHNAFNSQEALLRITNTTIDNIQNYLSGKLENTNQI
ncbi:MAG: NAD(P)-dependent oxidoreductase [Patescibacteria group bacterium]